MSEKQNKIDLGTILTAAGKTSMAEGERLAASAILGITKTIKESKWETTALIGSLVGNIAAQTLDLDLPFANLGVESAVGIDSFLDNASDVVAGAALTSLAYKASKNISDCAKIKSREDLLREVQKYMEISSDEDDDDEEDLA